MDRTVPIQGHDMTQTQASAPAKRATAKKAAKPKPSVAKLVHQLLVGEKTSFLPYDEIAERVRKKVPDAKTSARSVASVATGLRAAGIELPDRRVKH
jgi:hypothetical protein